nr:hypothetical protein [uncultured Mediterranean phage uvMED]BAR29907.1 hypothetical protein [uncultured Mediterranean phage uvMED]BAR29948.1 hypothetical protein [uncultured Mediterranean phage uvMED]
MGKGAKKRANRASRAAMATAQQQIELGNRLASLAERQEDLSLGLLGETEPIRGTLLQTLGDLSGATDPYFASALGGGRRAFTDRVPTDQRGILFDAVDPVELPDDVAPVTLADIQNDPRYAANKAAIESQFLQNQQLAMEQIPGNRFSGLLADQIGDVSRDRALALSSTLGGLTQEERARRERRRQEELALRQQAFATETARREGLLNLAAQLASNQAGLGTGGLATAATTLTGAGSTLGGAGGIQQGVAKEQAAIASAKKEGIGEALGAASSGCYIARLVFGDTNYQWLLFYDWKETRAPHWFRKFYNRYSQSIAQWLRNKHNLQSLIKYLMQKIIKE